MKKLCILSILLLALPSLRTAAQTNDEINVIRVKKKPVAPPDTGRYKGLAGYVSDWEVRPRDCMPRISSPYPQKRLFTGASYYRYTYAHAGIITTNPRLLVTAYGAALEACFDKRVYGAALFADRRVYEANRGCFLLGVHTGGYYSRTAYFGTAAPRLTFTGTGCFQNIRISYGYNFVTANRSHRSEGSGDAPLPPINTHHFTLSYAFPFYL